MNKHKAVWGEKLPFGSFEYAFVPSQKAWIDVIRRRAQEDIAYPEEGGMTTSFNAKLDASGRQHRVSLVTVGAFVDSEEPLGLVGLLAHEAMHVVQAFMEKIGEEKPSPEFQAYTLQIITSELVDAYCQTRKELFLHKGKRKA